MSIDYINKRRHTASFAGWTCHLIFVVPILFLAVSTIAADDKAFAEKILASMYTDDDSVYRALLHPSMKHCANRLWSKKRLGNPPSEFEYQITDVTQQAIKNEQGGASMLGLSDTSLLIEPTHEIRITSDSVNEYPEGHPCHTVVLNVFTALLVQDAGNWKITTVCIPQEATDTIAKKRSEGLKASEDRSKAIEKIYATLSSEQRDNFEKELFENEVKAIYAYSEDLGVDLTAARAFREKVCAEYTKRNPGNN